MEKKSFYFSEIVLATVEETSFKGDLRKLLDVEKSPWINPVETKKVIVLIIYLNDFLYIITFSIKILFFWSNKTRITLFLYFSGKTIL